MTALHAIIDTIVLSKTGIEQMLTLSLRMFQFLCATLYNEHHTTTTIIDIPAASWIKKSRSQGGAVSCYFPTDSCKFPTKDIIGAKFPQNGAFFIVSPKFCIFGQNLSDK